MHPKLDQLTREGYCVFENILSGNLLGRLRSASDKVLDANEYEKKRSNQGNIVGMHYQNSAFLDLITWPAAFDALYLLGFERPRFWSGFVIAKEFDEPPLYWHQDWVFWDEPEAAESLPHQLFLMYYLTDTRVENGCLRLIPRSHRQRFEIHDQLGKGHDSDIRSTADYAHPAFSRHPDEIDVAVKSGDLVIGDARLLHSANRNKTAQRRTVLTLWYLPRFDQASARVRAGYTQRVNTDALKTLTPQELDRLNPLLPEYEGEGEAAEWNRVPGDMLH